jgi:hypothetical protein
LPRAICPHGSPASPWQVSASGETLPGCSAIDAMLSRLDSVTSPLPQDQVASSGNLPPHTSLPPGGEL